MLKKLVAISLIIFFIAVTAVLAAGLAVHEITKNNSITNTPNTQTAIEVQQTLINSITSDLILNMAEIAKHNNSNNCWMAIDGKVYDVTKSISNHPGGALEIIKFCGTDATAAFQTKDSRGRDHSQAAYTMLTPYYIGNVNQKITAQKSTTPTNTTSVPETTNKAPIPPQNTNIQSPPLSPTSPPTANTALTMVELAKHNKSSDCWLLINGKLYNVTNYIGSHPGGANEIIKFCGVDATAAFQTKDGRGNNHSQAAYAMLAPYYIGDLNQNITAQQFNASVNQTNSTPPPTNRGETDDD